MYASAIHHSHICQRIPIEAEVLKDLKLRCSKWIPSDLDLDYYLRPWNPFQFFPLTWRIFVASFIKKNSLVTKEISHSQNLINTVQTTLTFDLWLWKSSQFFWLTRWIFVATIIEMLPLGKEISRHTNFVNPFKGRGVNWLRFAIQV